MGFYEKDGKRVTEDDAFTFALEAVENGDILMQDAFIDWFYRREIGWHHYPDGEEMESVDEITQQHINREAGYLRRCGRC